jgi:hypothetical protein
MNRLFKLTTQLKIIYLIYLHRKLQLAPLLRTNVKPRQDLLTQLVLLQEISQLAILLQHLIPGTVNVKMLEE